MNNMLRRFSFFLFVSVSSFSFLASMADVDLFKTFYNENKLKNSLPNTIETGATSFEREKRILGEGDFGISEEIFYDGEIASNNDCVRFSVKTIFLKNHKIIRFLSVKVYKQYAEKSYYFTSISLEKKDFRLNDCPGIFTILNSSEVLDFIKTFFNTDFIERISRCRDLSIFEIEE